MNRLTLLIVIFVLTISILPDTATAEQWIYQPGYNEFRVDIEAYLGGKFTPSITTDSNTIDLVWYTNHKDIIEIESSPYGNQCVVSFKKGGYGELVLSHKYWYNHMYYEPNPGGIGSWHSDRFQGVTVIIYRITVKDPLPANNTTDFAGGSGTAADPYLISTPAQLRNIEETEAYMYAHYKLINDISFADSDFEEGGAFYNNGIGWFPIGTLRFLNARMPFYGVFDGDGYTIRRLESYFNYTRAPVGLFAANAGTIKNLTIADSVFVSFSQEIDTGYNWVGSIAGINIGDISNCAARNNKLAGDVGGGICGVNQQGGNITNCYTYGNGFTSTPDSNWMNGGISGGIAGYHAGGSIDRTYSANFIYALIFDDKLYYPSVVGAITAVADDYSEKVSITNSYYTHLIPNGIYYDWTERNDSVIDIKELDYSQMASLASFTGFSPSVWYVDPNADYKYPQLYNSKNLQRALFISSKPSKSIYAKGEALDLSGTELTEIFTDGSSVTLTLTDMNIIYGEPAGIPEKDTVYISGFNNQATGMQILTVYYRDLTAYVEIYVYEGTLISKASTPAASPSGGFVKTGEKITLSTAEEGAFIYYTTDGTNPTIYSTMYTEPIMITQDTVIRAATAKAGLEISDILTAVYRITPDSPFAAMLISENNQSVTAQVNNNTGQAYDSAEVILAIYDEDGRLAYMNLQKTTLQAGINNLTFTEVPPGNTMRLFVWDSAMIPLCETDTSGV